MNGKIALALVTIFSSGVALGKGPRSDKGNCAGVAKSTTAEHRKARGEGAQAFQKLNLSDEQKAKIESIRAEHRKAVQNGELQPRKGAMQGEIRSVLTPEQQKQLDEIHAARDAL